MNRFSVLSLYLNTEQLLRNLENDPTVFAFRFKIPSRNSVGWLAIREERAGIILASVSWRPFFPLLRGLVEVYTLDMEPVWERRSLVMILVP